MSQWKPPLGQSALACYGASGTCLPCAVRLVSRRACPARCLFAEPIRGGHVERAVPRGLRAPPPAAGSWPPAAGSWPPARPADWWRRRGGRGEAAGLGAPTRRRRPLRSPVAWGSGGASGWCCVLRRSGPEGWPRPVSTGASHFRAPQGLTSAAASPPCCPAAGEGVRAAATVGCGVSGAS